MGTVGVGCVRAGVGWGGACLGEVLTPVEVWGGEWGWSEGTIMFFCFVLFCGGEGEGGRDSVFGLLYLWEGEERRGEEKIIRGERGVECGRRKG